MKVFSILFFLAINSAHADVYRMVCIASDLQSSMEIKSTQDKMVFSYTNKAGKKYFPLYNGVVTAKNLSHIKSTKSAISNINNILEMSWPLEQCIVKRDQPYLVKCSKSPIVSFPNDLKILANSFSTSVSSEQTYSFSYEKVNIKFNLVDDEKVYEISIPFSKERCFVEFETN